MNFKQELSKLGFITCLQQILWVDICEAFAEILDLFVNRDYFSVLLSAPKAISAGPVFWYIVISEFTA
jgi:hypothetical protein